MSKVVLSWGACSVKMGKTKPDGTISDTMTDVGTIAEKSTTLEFQQGDVMEKKSTGGKLIGRQELEGVLTLKTVLIEPSQVFEASILDSTHAADTKELTVKSLVIPEDYSVTVAAKQVGGVGITAVCTAVSYQPAMSEDDGYAGTLVFSILEDAAGSMYKRFEVS